MRKEIAIIVVILTIGMSAFLSGCLEGEEEGEFAGKITIDTIGEFTFNPQDIETVREDIFKEGHFSVFDILVYLDTNGSIDMHYHFDETMNTYVIDSIMGKENWWYMAYYDGGWPENNVYRMDHYPYKDKMYIRVLEEDQQMIDDMYDVFRDEVKRKEQNGGKIIIPTVSIRGPKTDLQFNNVTVKPHNLRNDVFPPGVITAIDVILSLGDENRLSYDLQWYDSIGSADVVGSYWINRINDDTSHGRCGFVYEAGSLRYRGFRGNHIHVPSDIRVINSPEYEEWFWICL
ncbi:MAG: hypothetical protein QMD22_03750 [archaeon]|nr:hypothetical protein [archaeon]